MSRAGYSDDIEGRALICWRGAVRAALHGRRGQAFLREALAALDALPEKRLITGELITSAGEVCAMGAVLRARGTDVSDVDPEEPEQVALVAGLAEAMVREIAYVNDHDGWIETPERRWARMRAWVASQIEEVARG